jgi:hypothetical protein
VSLKETPAAGMLPTNHPICQSDMSGDDDIVAYIQHKEAVALGEIIEVEDLGDEEDFWMLYPPYNYFLSWRVTVLSHCHIV